MSDETAKKKADREERLERLFREALGENDLEDTQAVLRGLMRVVEPLLNALDELGSAADRLNKTHADLVQDSPDPGSEALAAEWEMTRLLRRLQYFEPHDWTYISRFSATPQEIHRILKEGLCEDVYLNYQRFIAEPAVHEACEDLRERTGEIFKDEKWDPYKRLITKAVNYMDPAHGGGRYPAELLNPS